MSKREKTKQEKRRWVLTVVILSFALSVVMSVLTSLFVDSAGLPDCSALAVRRRRTTRTFAGREVFSSPHMSPKKMIGLSFAAAAAKGYEVLLQTENRRFHPEAAVFFCASK